MMWYLGPIAFVYPWMLAALAALPAIWWLLRAMPPAPRLERFPAIRLLLGLRETAQSPEHTPWWLLALRLLIAACVIAGLARPLVRPAPQDAMGGTLIMVIDDGWASGPQWQTRRAIMADLLAQADRNARDVLLVTTAASDAAALEVTSASVARARAASLQPMPWHLDRNAAAKRLQAIPEVRLRRPVSSVWLSDGLAARKDAAGAQILGESLRRLGPVSLLRDPPALPVMALLEPRATDDGLMLKVLRSHTEGAQGAELHALGEGGNIIAGTPVKFLDTSAEAEAHLTLPSGIRNTVTQIRIAGVHSAGAVWLLDDRWKRRAVGIVSGAGSDAAQQPLLDDLFYLERAMNPFADIRKGTIGALLGGPLSMLVLSDIGRIVGEDRTLVEDWLEKGGLLVRFAGPNMVEQSDDLIPVQLRHGGRALGGALSWDAPARLAPFAESSPFSGLAVPPEVTVARQILAQPDAGLAAKTWASLEDGTPLVTASRKGKGWNVLFHVTANMRWSNLPASGLYVSMLQRITALAQGTATPQAPAGQGDAPLGALVTLDGYGQLRSPLDTVRPYLAHSATPGAGPQTPPGYYGVNNFRMAVNLARDADDLLPLDTFPDMQMLDYAPRQESEAGPWLLSAALILWLVDGVIAQALFGRMPAWRRRRPASGPAAAIVLGFLAVYFSGSAHALENPVMSEMDAPAPEAVLETRLAYVITGDGAVDAMSAAGLNGLSKILRDRTAFEAAPPMGVDPERDELVFFPLLYWPMTEKQKVLSEKALSRIDAYMKNGGTIWFDTRDRLTDFRLGNAGDGNTGPGQAVLREILKSLDIPPLRPVSDDHVLTRSYYLLRDFPGRYAGGQLWVAAPAGDAKESPGGDGVSAIAIGANDWASAWAVDERGVALLPVEPGGETQRERAYRAGVNIVMYALTGNYKADQVHMPVLLERLGQ